MITDEQREKKLELIKNQAKILSSSFDTVHILATKFDPETDMTSQFNFGIGNHFARYGLLRDILIYEDAKTKAEGFKKE